MSLLDDAIREHLELMRRRGADPADIARTEREGLGPVETGPPPPAAEDVGIIPAAPLADEYDSAEDATRIVPPAAREDFAPSAPDPEPEPFEAFDHGAGFAEPEAATDEPAIEHAYEHPVGEHLVDDRPDTPAPAEHEEQRTVAFSAEDVAAATSSTPAAPPEPEPEPEPRYEREPEPEPEARYEPEPEPEPVAERPAPERREAPPMDERRDPEPVYERDPEPFEESAATERHDVPAPEPERGRAPAPEPAKPADEPAASDDVLEETPDFLQETPEHERLWFEQRPPRDFDF